MINYATCSCSGSLDSDDKCFKAIFPVEISDNVDNNNDGGNGNDCEELSLESGIYCETGIGDLCDGYNSATINEYSSTTGGSVTNYMTCTCSGSSDSDDKCFKAIDSVEIPDNVYRGITRQLLIEDCIDDADHATSNLSSVFNLKKNINKYILDVILLVLFYVYGLYYNLYITYNKYI